MKNFYPIPKVIKELMDTGSLKQLDSYLNPGIAGAVFHNYSMKFLKVLSEIGVFTFKELETAYNLCKEKKLSSSKRQRDVVQGHYTYYMKELESAEKRFNSLNEEQQKVAIDKHYIIEE